MLRLPRCSTAVMVRLAPLKTPVEVRITAPLLSTLVLPSTVRPVPISSWSPGLVLRSLRSVTPNVPWVDVRPGSTWAVASTRQVLPVPQAPFVVMVPPSRFGPLRSLLAIWVLIAHSIPDSASWRARAQRHEGDGQQRQDHQENHREGQGHPALATQHPDPSAHRCLLRDAGHRFRPRLAAPAGGVEMEQSKAGATGSCQAFTRLVTLH